jgi:hypothetical protein
VTSSPFVPAGAPVTFERIDQGVDFRTKPGGPVVAPWGGVVSVAPSNPGGFGTHYSLIRFTEGPHDGETWYIGHALNVHTGRVQRGDVIARTGHGSESWMGNAKGIPGHVEIGRWPPGSMSAGGAVKGIVLGGKGPAANQAYADPSASSSGAAGGDNQASFFSDPGGAIVSSLLGPVEHKAVRMLLYVVLIAGGATLLVIGTRTFAGGPRSGRSRVREAVELAAK